MIQTKHALFATIVATCLTIGVKAQTLYTYDNDEDGLPGTVATDVTASDLSWVNGPIFINACGSGFNSDHWSLSGGPFSTDLSAVELTLTPATCIEMTVTSMQFDLRSNPQGPAAMRYAYSTDGGASWTDNGSDYVIPDNPCGSGETFTWDMADFTTSGPVIFRIYGWDASTVNGQQSVLNGIVNGFVGPGGITWYADVDGDGYGDPSSTTIACDAPTGYVADNTDCNDADAAINPAANEYCGNGIDDNCDGIMDESITASVMIDGTAPVCAPLTVTLAADPAGDAYQWYRNGSMIAGATGATYDVTALRGDYKVMVTSEGCTDVSDSTNVRIYDPNDPFITSFGGTDLCINNPIKLKSNFGLALTHSYQWYRNGEIIPGATLAKYNASEAGEYYVEVYAPYPGCDYFSEVFALTADCRLEGNTTATTVDVYPNPTSEYLNVDMNTIAESGKAVIAIQNLLGEVVYTKTVEYVNYSISEELNLSSIATSGLFTLVVNTNGVVYQSRFVIQK